MLKYVYVSVARENAFCMRAFPFFLCVCVCVRVTARERTKVKRKREKRWREKGRQEGRMRGVTYVRACIRCRRARAPPLLAFHAASKSRGGENDDLEW